MVLSVCVYSLVHYVLSDCKVVDLVIGGNCVEVMCDVLSLEVGFSNPMACS